MERRATYLERLNLTGINSQINVQRQPDKQDTQQQHPGGQAHQQQLARCRPAVDQLDR